MSRYSCSYLVKNSPARLELLYDDLLNLSVFEVMHRRSDRFVLVEMPGKVSFSQLVTIELFNKIVSPSEIQIELLVKNNELPLRVNNRCRQCFDAIHQIITEHYRGICLTKISA
ncbi:hypothetical protein V0288_05895 [Pannus brasiliensis CCIBt3594]|uniref:Uncharacterized protein n=1 Tax=Pannus brasiliensis CCIBt3594 TaxID=1427578 RepID=A0AAW9QPK1_9CHRO